MQDICINKSNTMFNTFLTNILNSYLGEIVEDLDLDNIGSGALHGDILLIDLKLRSDCLSVLELPIEVKFGSIGKLSLKIPWTNLASSPVTVDIQVDILNERFTLCCNPVAYKTARYVSQSVSINHHLVFT